MLAFALVGVWGCGDDLATSRDSGSLVDAAPDGANLPDLMISPERIKADLALGTRNVEANSCELDPDEACIGGEGIRQLLYFSVQTPNVGDADLVLGMPTVENDVFDYSACHDHFHFNGYATYELLNPDGASVATGRKQAFCLLDTDRWEDAPDVSQSPRYTCNFQGISAGWADTYGSRLPCQFLDVTDLPNGDYILRVEINRERGLPESNYDNNLADVPIRIGDPALATPTESCSIEADTPSEQRAVANLSRECGWRSDTVLTCTPGANVSVGCSQQCGSFSLGECTGDPMLRVCDGGAGSGNCTNAGALGLADKACGNLCPIVFDTTCPESGMLEVFSAPRAPEASYTCTLEVFEG